MTPVAIVTRYPSEVCSLSGGTPRPYPLHYRRAFASSDILYPHPCQHALRRAYPVSLLLRDSRGTDTGLLRYAFAPEWVRSCLSAGEPVFRESRMGQPAFPLPCHSF